MAIYVVKIPGFRPATINQLMASVKQKIRLKKRDREFIALYVRVQGRVPLATGKRRVGLKLHMEPGERRPDIDSSHKSFLDALKYNNLIIDDGPLWLEITPLEYDEERVKGGMATTITIEDIK